MACSARVRRARRLAAPADRCFVADRFLAVLTRADANRARDRADEDAAVALLAGARRAHNRVDRGGDYVGRHDRLDLDLVKQRDVHPLPAVLLGVALLATATDD